MTRPLALLAALALAACSPTPTITPSVTTAITAGGSVPQGMDPFQVQDMLSAAGASLYVDVVQSWADIEPSPGKYDLADRVTGPLTQLVPKYPTIKSVLLVIKMIDTNARTMPADLAAKPFSDPAVTSRFLAMLHAVATSPGASRITYVLLGNEVDAYFAAHPGELSGFAALMKASVAQLHRDMPGVKVGTITTFGAINNPSLFATLAASSDFVDYTYYPVNGLSGGNVAKGWQMGPVSDTPTAIGMMAKAAGKPFSFTEIGYSAATLSGSSEDQQAAFVTSVFDTLAPYRKEGRVAFVNWANLADYPPGAAEAYAKAQGIEASPEFAAFMGGLGLRTYGNQPRKAWSAFVSAIAR